MPSPIFDKEQYELRGKVPTVYTEEQSQKLNEIISRVNGQLDWNAQLLGFNGPEYWGKAIPTTDGTYKWEGLPSTVAEKRAVQVASYGIYNKDKDYSQRPAPFNRSEVRASADLTFDIFESDGQTKVVPLGLPRDLLYEEVPRLIVGGEYTFNGLVNAIASGSQESLLVIQDLSQGITSVRILNNGTSAVLLSISGSEADPFVFFLEEWEDISDWTSEQFLNQYLGLWGNKGNWVSSHALFDALDVHGFSEENSLSLDDILKEISIEDLLALVGLKPGPASFLVTSHYNFKVEECDDFFNPTTSLETKITALQTQDLIDIETDSGDILSIETSECQNLPATMFLQADVVDLAGNIIDNGSLEETQIPDATLDNGPYPGTSSSTVDDSGLFTESALNFLTESGELISIDDASITNKPCYEPPDAEFGECDRPNFKLTLRQTFEQDPLSISTDPGPEASIPIGANGVLSLFPINPDDINNGEYDAPLGQFYLEGGDYDAPVPATNTVDERVYDRNPFSGDPGQSLIDYERVIDFDDLIIDIDGQPGPILMSDPGVDNEIVIVASDSSGEYDGFELAFDGLELNSVSFEYTGKTSLGEVQFPCVEWVFDPTLDNSTFFPIPAEAAWMTADDGEFDERPELDRAIYAAQTDVECVNATFISGFLAFDDGNYDEQIQPFCIPPSEPSCAIVDGGPYHYDRPPEPTICEVECGTIDNSEYFYDQIPFLGPPSIDGLGSAFIDDTCLTYDGEQYDRVVSPEIPCIGYDNGIVGEFLDITCVLADREFEENPAQFTEDQGEYTDTYLPTVCTPCGAELPDPQCYLDNGVIESTAPSSTEDEGIYNRPQIICQPCDPEPGPPVPCPVLPIRVRLDQIIFSSPAWRMRPSVANSKVPLRLWKNRTLNVVDTEMSSAYANKLIADRNTSSENPFSYLHYARLPVEYSRNSKFWNRTQAILANQSYFSEVQPLAETAVAPTELLPLLYDQVYSESTTIPNSAVFYVEDYLISQTTTNDLDPQSGFEESSLSYENPNKSKPFVTSTLVDYDPYEARLLRPDGSHSGSYLKWNGRCCELSGYLEDDIRRNFLRYTVGSETILSDSSVFVLPNVEFPDDEDRIAFSNYVVSYAYFAADLSAGDEPVFDPKSLYGRREECLLGQEDVSPVLATNNGLILATEDGDLIYGSDDEEIEDVCVETFTTYLLHERKPIPARKPRRLGNRAPKSSFVAIEPLEIEVLEDDTATVKVSILTGVNEPYFFRWEALFGPNIGWVNISDGPTFDGVTTAELKITPQDMFYDGAKFRIAVDSDLGFTYAVSQPTTLKVIPKLITIVNEPDDNLVLPSSPAVFFVGAVTNDRGTLGYQWQFRIGDVWEDLTSTSVPNAIITGLGTPSLVVTPLDTSLDGIEFRALVSSTGGAPTVASRAAKLNLLAGFITVSGPNDLYLHTREQGFFTVEATTNDGGVLSYEWQIDTGSGFVTLPVSEYIGRLFDDGDLGEQAPALEISTEDDRQLETEDESILGTNYTGPLSELIDDGTFEGLPYSQTVADEEYDQKISFFAEGPNLRVIALTSDVVGYRVRCIVSSSNTAPSVTSEGPGRLVVYGKGIYVTTPPRNLEGWIWSTYQGEFNNGSFDGSNNPTVTVTNGEYPHIQVDMPTSSDDGPAVLYRYGFPRLRDLSNFFVQAYSDDGGSLSYQWQVNRNEGRGWENLSKGDFFGQVYDNGELGSTFLPEEILAGTTSDIITDEWGREIGTNDTGNSLGFEFDNTEYDITTVLPHVSDESYDIAIGEYPEISFLYVRPFSSLAENYEYRCIITSSKGLTQSVTTDPVDLTLE